LYVLFAKSAEKWFALQVIHTGYPTFSKAITNFAASGETASNQGKNEPSIEIQANLKIPLKIPEQQNRGFPILHNPSASAKLWR